MSLSSSELVDDIRLTDADVDQLEVRSRDLQDVCPNGGIGY